MYWIIVDAEKGIILDQTADGRVFYVFDNDDEAMAERYADKLDGFTQKVDDWEVREHVKDCKARGIKSLLVSFDASGPATKDFE